MNLTVVTAATEGKYMKWAERLRESVYKYAPDIPVIIYQYEDAKDRIVRFEALLESTTEYTLHIEADSLVTGDVRPLVKLLDESGRQLLATPAKTIASKFDRGEKYVSMFCDAGLAYRELIGANFLIQTDLVSSLVSNLYRWADVPEPYTHMFRQTYTLALALATIGIGDEQTLYTNTTVFSYAGDRGIIHHLGSHERKSGKPRPVKKRARTKAGVKERKR